MQLSSEDTLRLNVLLALDLHAVRIDESRMVVHALSGKGEAKVRLNPTCRDEQYLKLVRQTLSTRFLGSPGGYPVYLRRWTRMGQARSESLDKLLLLGEPEAIAAVVHATGLTDDIARRAWWANPTAANARQMLERETVAGGSMGPELAEFLLEFLPFEEEPQDMIDSVRLILQPGLTSEAQRDALWARCNRKNSYYVGFMAALPDALPEPASPHAAASDIQAALAPLIAAGNPYAGQLVRVLGAAGQRYLTTAETVLRKPVNQDVVVALLDTVGDYFSGVRPDERRRREYSAIDAMASEFCKDESACPDNLREVIDQVPGQRERIRAMVALSMLGEQLVAPIFGVTDSIGSVMRKKIEPVTGPILEQFALLRSDKLDG
ncbi:MAG: sulfur reduction protein DsrS [Pseudomonadota bacterium]|nr:sulfur reduction protein DsrS [Pseudomonadota bacterium]